MEHISTLVATDPIDPDYKCVETLIPPVPTIILDIEELDTISHVQMVMSMHQALTRLNKTNPADYPCGHVGLNNSSSIFG